VCAPHNFQRDCVTISPRAPPIVSIRRRYATNCARSTLIHPLAHCWRCWRASLSVSLLESHRPPPPPHVLTAARHGSPRAGVRLPVQDRFRGARGCVRVCRGPQGACVPWVWVVGPEGACVGVGRGARGCVRPEARRSTEPRALAGVGKTALTARLVNKERAGGPYVPTIGLDFLVMHVTVRMERWRNGRKGGGGLE
jgi:hypothetical protein